MKRMTNRLRHTVLLLALAACGQAVVLPAAQEPDSNTACALDGMVLQDYPGAKAQIRYADGKTEYFCDVLELVRTLLAPEQERRPNAQYVQDMGKADWARPVGHWIPARDAVYVVGSRARGSMGATIVPFAQQADAQAFARREGGDVVRFADITLAMLDKTGGIAHGH